MTHDENDLNIDSLRANQEDMKIVGMAILGRSIHESYSNSHRAWFDSSDCGGDDEWAHEH